MPGKSRKPCSCGEGPAVSVLVPVFNAEPFLRECLDSLVGQTLDDLEIICIDDGSTDASARTLAEYAARDGRVRIISKANSGYGDSMNHGIAEARGRWIGICEPDDFCDRRMYAQLLRTGERYCCDMVKANYREHAQNSRHDALHEVFAGFPYDMLLDPHAQSDVVYTDPTIWTGLYQRSFLAENGISFSRTPGASYQDASFAHQCWISARQVVLMRRGFYHYRIDNVASSSKSGAKVFAVCEEYDRSLAFARARGGEDWRVFGPRLTLLRFAVYVWNYNRIAVEFRPSFVERWVADIVHADDEGLLDDALMTSGYRTLLCEVLEGPEALIAKYPDTIPAPPLR